FSDEYRNVKRTELWWQTRVYRMSDTESPLRTNSYAQCPAPQQCGTFAGQTHIPPPPPPPRILSPLGTLSLPGSSQRQNAKCTERHESYNNQDRSIVGQAADREEKGWAEGRRDEEDRGRERNGKREKNPRASSASGLLGTADSLRGYFKV
ncbi:hypothetical protein ALC56_10535, partial [Trachymyrmex septentrionalis]